MDSQNNDNDKLIKIIMEIKLIIIIIILVNK